jgi:hypothetical protein
MLLWCFMLGRSLWGIFDSNVDVVDGKEHSRVFSLAAVVRAKSTQDGNW